MLNKLGSLLNLVYYDGELEKGNSIIHAVKVIDNINEYSNCFAVTSSSRGNWADDATVVNFSAASDQDQSKWVTLITECLQELGEISKPKAAPPAPAPAAEPVPAAEPDPEGVASIGRRGTAAERLFAATEEAAAEMETEGEEVGEGAGEGEGEGKPNGE